MEVVTCSECGMEWRPGNPNEVTVTISTGYSTGGYGSLHGFPRIGEHHVHDEFKYVFEDVMSHRPNKAAPISRTARVRHVTGEEWREEDLNELHKLTSDELTQSEGDIPRIGEHMQLTNGYYEVEDVVWRKVYRPGTLLNTLRLGLVPEVYLRRVECDDWSERVSEELRAAGAASWGP
jgi:hypothetical protein